MDTISLSGQASGSVASVLLQNGMNASGFDPAVLRPWEENGRTFRSMVVNGKKTAVPITNADATLRKDEWKLLDDAVVPVAKERLRLVGALRSRGLQFVIPNGMGKTVLETESQSDINEASISMDGLNKGDSDRPVYELTNLPLPIVHKDFSYPVRQVLASRNGGSPLDTTMVQLATRRVAEKIEKLLIGTETTSAFGGGTIYGLTNHPDRTTDTVTTPTGSNNEVILGDILSFKTQLQQDHHYGPYLLLAGTDWDTYLDDDYNASKGELTLRERIMKIQGIVEAMTVDFLPAKTLLLVQLTPDVVRMIVGMEISVVQWETEGGMMLNFKVMAIMVPQVRSDYSDQSGLLHASYT